MNNYLFYKYNFLTGSYAYCVFGESNNCFRNFSEAVNLVNRSKTLDVVSILSILMKNYIIGDRTLIKEVKFSPWMGKPDGKGGWSYATLPSHGDLELPIEEISRIFKIKLMEEARKKISSKSKIGLLLSGGMDSRIVAGILRELQLRREFNGDVVVITWGIPKCRDVIYAKKIADRFDWEFRYVPLTASTLKRNISITGILGAEFSPLHLHAMVDVSKFSDLDIILAGSYGDSIGRAEYSGRRLINLKFMLDNHHNIFSFLNSTAEKEALKDLKSEISRFRSIFPRDTEISYREIEQQMHYMRRLINSALEVTIGSKIQLYQMFTDPDVFGFIWSLSPNIRNDEIYKVLLYNLPGDLYNIPWARTGKLFGEKGGEVDKYKKDFHHYAIWLRRDLKDYIISKILSNNFIFETGLFNKKAVLFWLKIWSKNANDHLDILDEKIAWLASFSVFLEKYEPVSLNYEDEESFVLIRRIIGGFFKYMFYKLYKLVK